MAVLAGTRPLLARIHLVPSTLRSRAIPPVHDNLPSWENKMLEALLCTL